MKKQCHLHVLSCSNSVYVRLFLYLCIVYLLVLLFTIVVCYYSVVKVYEQAFVL